MKFITLQNIKPYLHYNLCYTCGNRRELHECNNCLELYCVTCDSMKYNWCYICKNRQKK